MRQRGGVVAVLTALLVLGIMFSGAWAQGYQERGPIITPPVAQLTVTGKLTRVAAIGGETTGWAVTLDKPREIDGKELKRLEIDPAGRKLGELEDKHLQISGTWQRRRGIERGEYWVLVVKDILVLAD